jgi:hypothetical protein
MRKRTPQKKWYTLLKWYNADAINDKLPNLYLKFLVVKNCLVLISDNDIYNLQETVLGA